MHISNIDVDGVSTSYFRASPSNRHVEGCPYGTSNGANPNDYNEDKFKFDNALLALMMRCKLQTSRKCNGII